MASETLTPYLRAGHGTEARYQRHRRDGEPPCPACRDAATRARKRYKDRWKDARRTQP